MRSFVRPLRKTQVVFLPVAAALLLVAGGLLQSSVSAQDAGSAPLPPPGPPPPAAFQKPIPADQLAFLNDYAGRMEKDLRKDKRFNKLLNQVIPRTGYFYGGEKTLADVSDDVLDADPLPVNIRDGRYAMVGTSGGGFHGGRGFVWFDMKAGIGLGGIYFRPTNGEPTPTLAIYSRQLVDQSLSMSQLPLEFAQDFSQWEMAAQRVGFRPVDAAVGDALAVDQRLAGDQLLRAGHQVALDHHAHDALVARGNLPATSWQTIAWRR
jgi:hypothetical protein